MTLRFTKSQTEMCISYLTWDEVKEWLTSKTDNLTAISEPTRQCDIFDVSQPNKPPQTVTQIALFYCTYVTYIHILA
jgi:hypothetical protein